MVEGSLERTVGAGQARLVFRAERAQRVVAMKGFLPLFIVALVASPLAGCSSSSGGASPPSAADAASDAASDAAAIDVAPEVGDAANEAAPVIDDTVGDPCTADSQCDKTGQGLSTCSSDTFVAGSVFPTPVCLSDGCDVGDGTAAALCDGARGVCLGAVGQPGSCFPKCTFDGTGAAPKGCQGLDACNMYDWSVGASGIAGVGYCYGGCTKSADCAAGEQCQLETGECVTKTDTYTKKVGDPCTDADASATPPHCNCNYDTTTKQGYCTSFCKVGDASVLCPVGFTCSAQLPTTDKAGKPLFSTQPAGIAGSCLKSCAADADCTALGGYCADLAGGKACVPGARP